MKKIKKRRKRESFTLKEDVGKYLLDLSKLVFAGIVLGTVLRYELPREILLTSGIAAVILLFVGGLIVGIRKVNHPSTKLATPTCLATPRAKKTAIKRLKRRKR
jgi:ABC-type iron transport system FetAB permease component